MDAFRLTVVHAQRLANLILILYIFDCDVSAVQDRNMRMIYAHVDGGADPNLILNKCRVQDEMKDISCIEKARRMNNWDVLAALFIQPPPRTCHMSDGNIQLVQSE